LLVSKILIFTEQILYTLNKIEKKKSNQSSKLPLAFWVLFVLRFFDAISTQLGFRWPFLFSADDYTDSSFDIA
jgi:hypothetical protein